MKHETFFDAVLNNDIEAVTTYLKDLDKTTLHEVVNENGQTPLMVATLKNNLALATILLHAGFDPSQKDVTMLPPFIGAASNGFDKILSVLISAKPDPTQYNRFGGTALLPSAEKGYLKAVQVAIDYGVPVNHQNRLGWSALLEAVILGDGGFLYQDIARELMDHGADITEVDFEGVTPLQYSIDMKQSDFQAILEKNHHDDFAHVRKLIRDEQLTDALIALYEKDASLKQYFYLGYTYERLNSLEAAQYYFEKGLASDPQFAFYLANLVRRQNKVDEALDYFLKGASQTTTYYFDYHRSNYLRELGRHEEAVVLMDELLAQYPDRTDFMFHKANSLRTLGRHQEAYDTMILADQTQGQNPLFKEQAEVSKQLMEGK